MYGDGCKTIIWGFAPGGLEIPSKYVFKTVESTESEKARALIKDILAIKTSTILN